MSCSVVSLVGFYETRVSTRAMSMADSTHRVTVDDHLGLDKVVAGSGGINLHRLDGPRTVSTAEGAPKSADPFIGKK